jgi:hypothetical protein
MMTSEDDGGGPAQTAVTELTTAVDPFVDAVESAADGEFDTLLRFFESAGVDSVGFGADLERVVSVLEPTIEAWERLEGITESIAAGETPDPSTVKDAIGVLEEVFSTVSKLDDLEFEGAGAVGGLLVDYLLVRHIEHEYPSAYNWLVVGGVVDPDGAGEYGSIDFAQVSATLENPLEATKDRVGWGSDEIDVVSILMPIGRILSRAGFTTSLSVPNEDTVGELASGTGGQSPVSQGTNVDRGLRIPLLNEMDSGKGVLLGLEIVSVPGSNGDLPGIAVRPYGNAAVGQEFEMGEDWTFTFEASVESTDWGLRVRPKQGEEGIDFGVPSLSADSVPVSGEAGIDLSYDPSEQAYSTILGAENASRLDLGSASLSGSAAFESNDLSVNVELPTDGRLVLAPQGGFLEKVIPEDISFDFEATVGWSNGDGLYFEGGGTLEASIPMHLDLGFATIEELFLALNPNAEGSDLAIESATSPKIDLGPLKGSVKRMGIEGGLSFPKGNDGNLGPVDLDVGFRPPDGLSLAIDTGPVTGGGFMIFEPEKHRYAGGLQLQFSSWGLQVVGLLKTKLPDSDGFSLLLLVTADLPPIQLGFGFVMNGIGGLAGIHRGFKKKPLGNAVRSGNLDSVLFPEDVVENADQIITDLRTIFPPKADKHVFGPMLRLGWGTPVIVQAELGVLVAIPDWKIALLGKFMVDLPDEEVALVDINLAVVGVLDIPNKELSIDASLYDSRIVTWTVSGDMAMRLSWGADSRFMLSIGGFHPRYEPPKSFPELDRVKASMAVPGGNPRLEYTGYLAVTPNTFQVGAGVVLHGEFGPAVVHGELSFDALFRFNPFEFVVDFFAKLAVKIAGKGLSLELDGSFSGPQPYHVKGKLKIDILLLSVTVTVDAEFGPEPKSRELATANVLPTLADELATPANWSAQEPEGDVQLVTLRDPDAGGDGGDSGEPKQDTLLAHPLGTLAVRQQVVPLGVPIEKYGNAKPVHEVHRLSSLSVTGVDDDLAGKTALREKFAPAKFKQLSDSEKLNSEAFEKLPAGRTVDDGPVHYAGRADGHQDLLSWATLDFETSVIDEENDSYRTSGGDVEGDWETTLGLGVSHELAEQSAVATADSRTTGPQAYANPDQTLSVSVSDQTYVVVWADSLQRLDVDANPASGQTQTEAETFRTEYVAAHDDVAADDLRVVGSQEVADGNGGGSP